MDGPARKLDSIPFEEADANGSHADLEAPELGFVEDLKKQWMAMIDAVSDPLAIIDMNYEILRQNLAYSDSADHTGLAITDFQGRKCFEVFAGRTSPCTHCRLVDARSSDSSVEWQSSNELKRGRSHVVRIHPLVSSSGVRRYVVHYRDVTEFVALREKLAHADKLAALGKLAGGVAHEINSPLAGIMAFTQMLLKEISEDDPHRDDLVEIEDAARKCKVIVENLLGFARQDKPTEIFEFNVLDTLDSTLRLGRAMLLRSGVELRYEMPDDPGLFVIKGRSGKIGQVFLNLITNAIHAMGDHGGLLNVYSRATPDSVTNGFEDNGQGMPPEVMKRIFDPFFTTKPIGQGTGLGLSISYAIVKQHGGTIDVRSAPGHGTCFLITLPRDASEEEQEAL
jgi:two-component system NtrC family sensor kinase